MHRSFVCAFVLCALACASAHAAIFCVPPGTCNRGFLGLANCTAAYDTVDVLIGFTDEGRALGEARVQPLVSVDDPNVAFSCYNDAGTGEGCDYCLDRPGPTTRCGGTSAYLASALCAGRGCVTTGVMCWCGRVSMTDLTRNVSYVGTIPVNVTRVVTLGRAVGPQVETIATQRRLLTAGPDNVLVEATGYTDRFILALRAHSALITWIVGVNVTCEGCLHDGFYADAIGTDAEGNVGYKERLRLSPEKVVYPYSDELLAQSLVTVSIYDPTGRLVTTRTRASSYVADYVIAPVRRWVTAPHASTATFSRWPALWQSAFVMLWIILMTAFCGTLGWSAYVVKRCAASCECVWPDFALCGVLSRCLRRLKCGLCCCRRRPERVGSPAPDAAAADPLLRSTSVTISDARAFRLRPSRVTTLGIMLCCVAVCAETVTISGTLRSCTTDRRCRLRYVGQGTIESGGKTLSHIVLDRESGAPAVTYDLVQAGVRPQYTCLYQYTTGPAKVALAVYIDWTNKQVCPLGPATCYPQTLPVDMRDKTIVYGYRQGSVSLGGSSFWDSTKGYISNPSLYGAYTVAQTNGTWSNVFSSCDEQFSELNMELRRSSGGVTTVVKRQLMRKGDVLTHANATYRLTDIRGSAFPPPPFVVRAVATYRAAPLVEMCQNTMDHWFDVITAGTTGTALPTCLAGTYAEPPSPPAIATTVGAVFGATAAAVNSAGVYNAGKVGDAQFAIRGLTDTRYDRVGWGVPNLQFNWGSVQVSVTGPEWTGAKAALGTLPGMYQIARDGFRTVSGGGIDGSSLIIDRPTATWVRTSSWEVTLDEEIIASALDVKPRVRPDQPKDISWQGTAGVPEGCFITLRVYSAGEEDTVKVSVSDQRIALASPGVVLIAGDERVDPDADAKYDVLIKALCADSAIHPGSITLSYGSESLAIAYVGSNIADPPATFDPDAVRPSPNTTAVSLENDVNADLSAVVQTGGGGGDDLGFGGFFSDLADGLGGIFGSVASAFGLGGLGSLGDGLIGALFTLAGAALIVAGTYAAVRWLMTRRAKARATKAASD